MPSRFRQVNEVCLRRRKSRYTPGAKTAGPSPEKGDTGGAWILSAPNEENARRAECPPPCNSPASRPGASAPRLHPTFSGGFSQWRTFVPAAKAASVHPCAHSAVRVGLPTPFLSGCRLTPTGAFAADSHTASSDMIHFPAPCPHRAILIIHDSPGKVNGPPHAKRLCIAGLQKTAAAARSPLVLPEKRMYNQGQWDRARKPRDAPRESLSASVKEAKEEHCHGNFARDQPGAGGSGVLRLPGQRPYPGPAGGALTGPGRPEGGALPSGQRRPAGAAAGPGHGGFRPGRDPAASVRRHQGLFLQHHRIL